MQEKEKPYSLERKKYNCLTAASRNNVKNPKESTKVDTRNNN